MDLIDRREAMAELYDVFFDDDLKAAYPDKADVVLDVIRKLPSAQSDEKRTEERTKTHACDLISRSAAITAIQKAYTDTEGGTDKCAVWKNVGLTNALHIMQDLPSAQPDVSDTNVGDMISRQAAIDALCSECQGQCIPCESYPCSEVEVINALPPAQPEQRWIPCSERLPERGEDVLVTRDYDGRKDNNKSCRYVEVASCYGEDDDITWSSFSDEYKMHPKNHYVVAWMPLPEPYREGEQDE